MEVERGRATNLREVEKETGEKKKQKTFHLSCFFRRTDGTVKHQEDELLLRMGEGGVGCSVVK